MAIPTIAETFRIPFSFRPQSTLAGNARAASDHRVAASKVCWCAHVNRNILSRKWRRSASTASQKVSAERLRSCHAGSAAG